MEGESINIGDITADLSDDDLPVVDFSTEDNKNFELHSIVWVRCRRQYWPALVTQVYKKEKKVTVVYVDAPVSRNGSAMKHKLSYERVKNFNCTDKDKYLRGSGPDEEKIRAAIELAQNYIIAKSNGNLYVEPLEYFKSPISNVLRRSQYLDKSAVETKNETDCSETINASSEFKEKVADTDETDCETNFNNEEDSCEDQDQFPEVPQNDEYVNKLLEIIYGNECKEYLLGIFNNQIQSVRHESFYSSPTKRSKLQRNTFGCGPIRNLAQQSELIASIRKLCEEEGRRTKANNELDNFLTLTNYAFDVGLYEALVFAVQKLHKLDRETAEERLHRFKLNEDL